MSKLRPEKRVVNLKFYSSPTENTSTRNQFRFLIPNKSRIVHDCIHNSFMYTYVQSYIDSCTCLVYISKYIYTIFEISHNKTDIIQLLNDVICVFPELQ